MDRAKPEGKITEVVDDMVDAVAGADPLVPVKSTFFFSSSKQQRFVFSYVTFQLWMCNSDLAF